MKRRTYPYLLILTTVVCLGACSGSGTNSDSGIDDTGGSDDSGSDSGSDDSANSDSGSDDSSSSDAGGAGGSTSAGSTSAIAGLWDLPADSAFSFDIAEITPNGGLIAWDEDAFNNCYNFEEDSLVNQGNNNYAVTLSEGEVLVYNFVNEGNSLRFTFPQLFADESWPALVGVSTSDFNLCP